MEQIIGWIFLLTIFFFLILWTKKKPYLKDFILVAFLLRALCVLINEYEIIILPDSQDDARTFELIARKFSSNYGLMIVLDFFNYDSLLISRFISIFYTIFGESKMMAQSISVVLGTLSVHMVYYLSNELWDHHSAKKAAWVAALFPNLVLYSSLTLREPYIVFFLLISLIGILRFMQKNSFNSFLQAITGFFLQIFFHGPAAVGGFIFLLYLILNLLKKQIKNLYNCRLNLSSFFIIIISLIPLTLFLTDNFKIPYIGGIQTLFEIENSLNQINSFIIDIASYPSWLTINNGYELFVKTIFKIFYFLFSPFIWDIKSSYHLIGLFDGTLYMILTIYVIKNWHSIWQNPVTRIFLLIFISYIVIYGLGIGNFGTAIRHRSKFVVMLIILAAPKIHRFIFSTHKKLYNK